MCARVTHFGSCVVQLSQYLHGMCAAYKRHEVYAQRLGIWNVESEHWIRWALLYRGLHNITGHDAHIVCICTY